MATKKRAKKATDKPTGSAGETKAEGAVARPRRIAKRTSGKRHSPESRARILADARANKLTGKQVAAKHGISMITYYNWRKKAGTGPRRARRTRGSGLDDQLRMQIKDRIAKMIPDLIRTEIDAQMAAFFGGGARRRGRPRKVS